MNAQLQALLQRVGSGVLDAADPRISFDTNLSPRMVLYEHGRAKQQPSPVVRWMQPTIYVETQYGTEVIAPHGVATQDWSPVAKGITLVLGLAALRGFVAFIR